MPIYDAAVGLRNSQDRPGQQDHNGDDANNETVLERFHQARFMALFDTGVDDEVDRRDGTNPTTDQAADQKVQEPSLTPPPTDPSAPSGSEFTPWSALERWC